MNKSKFLSDLVSPNNSYLNLIQLDKSPHNYTNINQFIIIVASNKIKREEFYLYFNTFGRILKIEFHDLSDDKFISYIIFQSADIARLSVFESNNLIWKGEKLISFQLINKSKTKTKQNLNNSLCFRFFSKDNIMKLNEKDNTLVNYLSRFGDIKYLFVQKFNSFLNRYYSFITFKNNIAYQNFLKVHSKLKLNSKFFRKNLGKLLKSVKNTNMLNSKEQLQFAKYIIKNEDSIHLLNKERSLVYLKIANFRNHIYFQGLQKTNNIKTKSMITYKAGYLLNSISKNQMNSECKEKQKSYNYNRRNNYIPYYQK